MKKKQLSRRDILKIGRDGAAFGAVLASGTLALPAAAGATAIDTNGRDPVGDEPGDGDIFEVEVWADNPQWAGNIASVKNQMGMSKAEAHRYMEEQRYRFEMGMSMWSNVGLMLGGAALGAVLAGGGTLVVGAIAVAALMALCVAFDNWNMRSIYGQIYVDPARVDIYVLASVSIRRSPSEVTVHGHVIDLRPTKYLIRLRAYVRAWVETTERCEGAMLLGDEEAQQLQLAHLSKIQCKLLEAADALEAVRDVAVDNMLQAADVIEEFAVQSAYSEPTLELREDFIRVVSEELCIIPDETFVRNHVSACFDEGHPMYTQDPPSAQTEPQPVGESIDHLVAFVRDLVQ